ncbi:MAG: hypothetical protein WBZ28_19090 [Pseudolabrys sp.]
MAEVQVEKSVRNDPFWPAAVIAFGLGLTAAWVVLIIFALVRLIELATRIAS